MRGFGRKNRKARSVGQVVTAALVGSAVAAAVSLLMNPTRMADLRRRITGQSMTPRDAHLRAKTAQGNVEEQARTMVGEVPHHANSTEMHGI